MSILAKSKQEVDIMFGEWSRISTAILITLVLIGSHAIADDSGKKFKVDVDSAFNGKYVWRGINLVDGWVWQPSVTASHKWISASIWGSMELGDENYYPGEGSGEGKFTELDYTLEAAYDWKKLSFATGVIQYRFPNTGFDKTTEVYASLGFDVVLSPTLAVYRDVDLAKGLYGVFSIDYAVEEFYKSDGLLSVGAEAGASVAAGDADHNEFYYGYDDDAFRDAVVYVALPAAVGEYWSVTPSASYSTILYEDIGDSFDGDEDEFWWGVSLAASF